MYEKLTPTLLGYHCCVCSQDLRKDLQQNLGHVDFNKYQLPNQNLSDNSTENAAVIAVQSFSKPRKRAKALECLCANEGQINDHDLDPKE